MSAAATSELAAAGAESGHTAPSPMMAQYHAIKAGYPDCLLFYRMGDFYELFFDDAVAASATLGITLTKRGKHQGDDIPMCGVPVHAADDYLHRLIANGHRVAVCEQTEDPAEAKKRGSKSVVRRDVTRLVTPGTLTEDSLLDGRAHNYLASVARVKAEQRPFAIAWIDISTGELCVAETDSQALAADLARLEPSEIVLPDTLFADDDLRGLWQDFGAALSPLAASRFDSQTAARRLKEHFGVAALEAYGDFGRAELAALGALIDYVGTTQIGRMPAIRPPVRERRDGAMVIDPATRANLELTRTLSGERRGSLLSVIDRTVTGAGARKLADRLAAPLTDPRAIGRRLDAVSWLADSYDARRRLREALRGVPDLARALARLTVGRGGPRDLGAIRDGLAVARALPATLGTAGLAPPPDLIASAIAVLAVPPGALEAELGAALADELPLLARDGGFIRAGHDDGLDGNRRLRDDSRKVIAGLQSTYAEATAIRTLKIKHNNVLGYFIEVTAQHGATLMAPPHDTAFIHRQTLANVMRFTTPELADLQSRISAAADRALAVELEVFDRLAAAVESEADAIAAVADALAELDVASSLADLAEGARWVRPVVDDSLAFAVAGGRHPVVESALAAAGEAAFVPNDCDLTADPGGANDQRHIWLLTGPNMAGKSTFLRQNALIAILAQMGSFVPAAAAHVGVVDRLFSRVGAADDLARGRSTFMVEMVETATILNQAGPKSLVILDEIGRGTATFDGLSIAWACVEHLHEVNRSRALFATHFHELTALAETLPRLANASVKVREWQGEVIFLHEVGPGAADRSYGIQVARLAGLPPAVTERAAEVLAALERGDQEREKTSLADDLPLFTAARPRGAAAPGKPSAVEAQLREILPDTLTPRDALDILYRLKALLDG